MDTNRRKFLKLILIGGGAFIAGKILNPLFSKPFDKPLNNKLAAKSAPPAFKVVEDEKVLSIYDNSGEEVLQIDKSN